ncbi:pimeloyl-ACP methyl ester carboxylesterase [Aliiruegeria haliotis]|uniref:Pimeloyl-ACP methyl ester carboxylesterase n=1 Tax=Aliiruegeria haliotis TaxID=1280846 RepID=A0A2T0RYZ7_9RHOB|nr:alpha/beta hydrolase [Aliiruegeria haliotis]PRY26401.1 pimeloyl-ACP methyl ester carboxylesterase [Aliiruegeria haliotis]
MNMIPRIDFAVAAAATSSNLPVVALHGTAMNAATWTGLREHAGSRLSFSAPTLAGSMAGTGGARELEETTDAVAREILQPGKALHLVGHDFGAVVVMKIAAAHPGHVASLTLVEPTAFNVLSPTDETSGPIRRDVMRTMAQMRASLANGDTHGAMECYIDCINGQGTWGRTAPVHRQDLSGLASRALSDLHSVTADRMTPAELATIVCPVLLIRGGRTSRALQHLALEIRRSVPFVREEVIEGAGHFPHLTDPHLVDPMIVEFLVRVDRQWQDSTVTLRQAA